MKPVYNQRSQNLIGFEKYNRQDEKLITTYTLSSRVSQRITVRRPLLVLANELCFPLISDVEIFMKGYDCLYVIIS